LALALGWPLMASARSELPELPGWQPRSQARMRFLGLSVYEVALWSPEAVTATSWAQQPLALALTYARSLKGELIAERSLKEMRRQGEIAEAKAERWLAAMKTLFPDVRDGDRLTGRHDPQQGASFWFQGQPRRAAIELDAEFSRLFFGIWLHPQTSEPALRAQLLGLK
jgi:hypothetical protein